MLVHFSYHTLRNHLFSARQIRDSFYYMTPPPNRKLYLTVKRVFENWYDKNCTVNFFLL